MIMVSICLLCNYIDVDIVQKYTDKSLALGHFFKKIYKTKREKTYLDEKCCKGFEEIKRQKCRQPLNDLKTSERKEVW